MKKYILFDLDGVVLDSEIWWPEALFREIGKHIPDWTMEKQDSIKGASMNQVREILTDKFGYPLDPVEHEKLWWAAIEGVYDFAAPVDGIEDLLKNLQKLGVILAVVASNRRATVEKGLKDAGLIQYFERIFTVPEAGLESKANGEIYELAVRELGAEKGDCVVVEDSRGGVSSGKAAGLFVVGFKAPGSDQDLSAADAIIDNIGDVEKFL